MVAIARGPSSLRSATICTSRLPSSTTSLGHTTSINSCLGTTRSRRSTSARSTSNARAPTLAGVPSISTLRCIASISIAPLLYLLLDRVGLASSMAVRLGRFVSRGKCPPARLIRINARHNDPKRRSVDDQPTADIRKPCLAGPRRSHVRPLLRQASIGDGRDGCMRVLEAVRRRNTHGGPNRNRRRVRLLRCVVLRPRHEHRANLVSLL